VADLYLVLFNSIKTNSATGHGREGIYFGENGEHTMYEVGKFIGDALVALGKSDSSEPTTFTKEEIRKYFKASHGTINNSLRLKLLIGLDLFRNKFPLPRE